MATIWPEPHLLFVYPDGEGGDYIRIQAKDGSTQVYDLTDDRALKLIADITDVLRRRRDAVRRRPV